MSVPRQDLRGLGYQKKGGRKATQAHNEAVRAAAPAAPSAAAPSPVHPRPAVPPTDAAAAGGGRTDRMVVVGAALGAAVGAAVSTGLLTALVR